MAYLSENKIAIVNFSGEIESEDKNYANSPRNIVKKMVNAFNIELGTNLIAEQLRTDSGEDNYWFCPLPNIDLTSPSNLGFMLYWYNSSTAYITICDKNFAFQGYRPSSNGSCGSFIDGTYTTSSTIVTQYSPSSVGNLIFSFVPCRNGYLFSFYGFTATIPTTVVPCDWYCLMLKTEKNSHCLVSKEGVSSGYYGFINGSRASIIPYSYSFVGTRMLCPVIVGGELIEDYYILQNSTPATDSLQYMGRVSGTSTSPFVDALLIDNDIYKIAGQYNSNSLAVRLVYKK